MNECIFFASSATLAAATIFSLPHIPNYFDCSPNSGMWVYAQIELRLFTTDRPAIALYEKLGCQTRAISMMRELCLRP